jgi:hypothetical protein
MADANQGKLGSQACLSPAAADKISATARPIRQPPASLASQKEQSTAFF